MVHVCRLLNDLYIFLMPVNCVCHSFSNVMEMSREKLSHFRSPSDPGVSRQQSNAPINGRYIKHAFFNIKKVCLVHAYLFVIIQLNVLYLYFKRYNYHFSVNIVQHSSFQRYDLVLKICKHLILNKIIVKMCSMFNQELEV